MSKIAFIYPGQGAQKTGMGHDFYESYEVAKAVYDEASAYVDFNIKNLCFEEEQGLDETKYTQMAMVTTSLAITKVLKEEGITPVVTAGLSLGEYTAIATAGACSVNEAVSLVKGRGLYMQEAVPLGVGTMSAVLGMDTEKIEVVLEHIEGAEIANYNCPGQIVITGTIEGVKTAEVKLKEAGARRVMGLNVSGPFHSSLLKGAGEKLAIDLETLTFQPLEIPYITNVTGKEVRDAKEIAGLLEQQVSSSVRWEDCVRTMIDMGVDTFVEIGPGKTLAGFMKKIDASVTTYNIATVDDMEGVLPLLKEKLC